MKVNLTLPELMLIAATRAALGVGIGLLLAPRFATGHRRAVGLALVAVGGLSTIPIAMEVFGQKRSIPSEPFQAEVTPIG